MVRGRVTKETAEKFAIKQYVFFLGGFVYHNLAGLGCYAGLADLTAVIKGKVIQIEVKAGKGKQSENQQRFQHDWEYFGGKYVCGDFDTVKAYLDKLFKSSSRGS